MLVARAWRPVSKHRLSGCAVLCCAVLCCFELASAVLCCAALNWPVECCAVLQRNMFCSAAPAPCITPCVTSWSKLGRFLCWWVTATPLALLLLDGLQVQDRTASSVQVTFAGASSSSSASSAIPHVRLGDVLPEICITLKDSSNQVLRRTDTNLPTVLAPTAETELLGQGQLSCSVELLAG